MTGVYSDFDYTDDRLISDLVRCIKNPAKEIRNHFKQMRKDQYSEITEVFEDTFQYINPNKHSELKQGLLKLVQDDPTIKDSTVVDLVNGVTKERLSENENSLESILAGLFLYIMKYTKNTMNRSCKKTNGSTAKKADNQPNPVQTSSSDVNENDSTESEEIFQAVQDFCIKYEDELDLLPLCQIAFNIAPMHNNVRRMYTDYNRCPHKVKEAILRHQKIPMFAFTKGWMKKAIKYYESLVKQYALSTKEFLYEGAKYLHGAFHYYSDYPVDTPNPYLFSRPFKIKSSRFIDKDHLSTIGFYIEDYLWYKKNDPSHYVQPPMDYLWEQCDLGNCGGPEMTFWVCRFIISSSYKIGEDGPNIEEFWGSVSIEEHLLKTLEDMYYYALLQLYLLTLSEEECKASLVCDDDDL